MMGISTASMIEKKNHMESKFSLREFSTPYANQLNLERSQQSELLIPYNSIIAIGDFVVVSEEDLV